jgi:hypothetical protein
MTENDRSEDFKKSAVFLNELDDGNSQPARAKRTSKSKKAARPREKGLFGLKPGQGFIVAALVLLFVCLAGFAVLVIMEKMVLPF